MSIPPRSARKPLLTLIVGALMVGPPAARADELTRGTCRMLEASLTDSFNKEAAELRKVIQPQVTLATQFYQALNAQERRGLRLREQGLVVANLEALLARRIHGPLRAFMRPIYQCQGHPELAEANAALFPLNASNTCHVDFAPDDSSYGETAALYRSSAIDLNGELSLNTCVMDRLSTTLHLSETEGAHPDEQGTICLSISVSSDGLRLPPRGEQEQGPALSVESAIRYTMGGSRREWVRERLGDCEGILRPSGSAALQLSDADAPEREALAIAPEQPYQEHDITERAI